MRSGVGEVRRNGMNEGWGNGQRTNRVLKFGILVVAAAAAAENEQII